MSPAPGHWTASTPYRSDAYRIANRERMARKRAEPDSAYDRYDREYHAVYDLEHRYERLIAANERANRADQEKLDDLMHELTRRS